MRASVNPALRDAIVAALAEGGTPVAPHAVHAVLAGEGAQLATIRTVAAAAARYGVTVAARRAA